MKSNQLLWAAIIIVSLSSAWFHVLLTQKVNNLEYVVERLVEVDAIQIEAIQQLTQNTQDIIEILGDHDAFIEGQQSILYE